MVLYMDGENLVKSLNKNGKNLQVDIQVITLSDNLSHPYFSLIDISKNNYMPIGTAKMEAPYTPYISNYWIKYNGVVVVSFNMVDLDKKSDESLKFLESNKIKQRIVNNEYNYSLICKVSRFKQEGKKFVIYFEDLGWKFMQKVPKEFRDTYIAGQYLDDAFQAICEFLGVQFAYSIEDLHAFSFGTDGYSVQKEGGEVIEDTPSILKELRGKTEDNNDEQDPLDDPMNENPGLIDFDKNKKNDDKNNDDKNTATSSTDNNLKNEDTSKEDEKNFNKKVEKYQEEFERKILDLFYGNSYYESDLVNPTMNYGNITITPRVVENNTNTSSMSTVNGSESQNGDESQGTEGNGGGEASSSGSSSTVGAPGVWGKTAKGSYYLTKEAINKMSREEAWQRYQDGKKNNRYTAATMSKLLQRSFGIWLF